MKEKRLFESILEVGGEAKQKSNDYRCASNSRPQHSAIFLVNIKSIAF